MFFCEITPDNQACAAYSTQAVDVYDMARMQSH